MSGGDRVIRWSTAFAVLGVAAGAAVASYEHAYDLVRAHGETGWTGSLVPLTVDGLPAHRTPAVLSSSNQSAEAKGDSSGDRELKTGTLDVNEHRTLPAPGTTISGTLHLASAIDVPSVVRHR